MGVHHAWGRAYKDLYQRFHAMLGEDQRYQNGFDCQGLWVEVNVERDLGFTSKRDIEAYGIDRFVTLCKQRVLTYAARQTEQSIRLGMWMDWNDPDELRRLHDLLGDGPVGGRRRSRARTARSPTRSRCSSGGSGMPEVGGSYFTFSNENNDLIWGFLAECHRRGWLYKGHDTMPWCAALRDGLSQMEMNEGYQDREDPGLTVRFPLVDRPGRGAARLDDDALDADLERRRGGRPGPALRPGPPGRRRSCGSARARSRPRSQGPFDGRGRGRRRRPRRLALRRPVRRPAGRPRRPSPTAGYEHRVVAVGRGRRGRGHRHRPHRARAAARRTSSSARRSACRSIGPIDEDGHRTRRASGALTGRDAPRRRRADRRATSSATGCFYHLEPYIHRYPHCWRCGTPLLFRLVDEWFISMGPVYDQPRETLTPEQVDASLRYQIMDVVDRIRWIPDFGYERELDWLRNMHDWMISKKRYWGLALPIYDCAACGTVEVIGGRDELRERAVEGWDAFEGHTPHRPWVDAVTIACPSCGEPVERIKDVGNPWLDAGIVPFSTLHFREDPDYWAKWFPADFITESFPGQFRNWFYSMLAMSTVLRREEPFKTIFGYALRVRRGRPPDAQELGQRDRVRRGRRPDGRRRHALDVRQGPARGEHPVRLARRRRGAPRAARPVERLRVLRDLRPAGRLDADRIGDAAPPRERPVARPLDPVARGRHGRGRRGAPARRRRGRARRARCRRSSTTCRPGTCACRASGCAATTTPRTARRRSRRSTRRSSRRAGCSRRSCRSWPRRCTGTSSRRSTTAAPDSVHLTRWPTDELAGHRDPELEDAMGVAQRAVDLARTLRSAAGLRIRQPLARAWLAVPDRGAALGLRAARSSSRRGQRQGRRADRRRVGARRAPGQAAAAEGRQAPRLGDPGGHGRRPRRRRRRSTPTAR